MINVTAITFRDLRLSLNLTVNQWAFVLNVTPRGIRKWESGDNNLPGPVVAFCRLLMLLGMRKRREVILHLLGGQR